MMRKENNERGSALILTAVISLLIMSIWALAYRSTSDLIRVEKQTTLRSDRDTTVTTALAAAVALLHTGPPTITFPDTEYQCIFIVGPDSTKCTATYTEPVSGTWNVECILSTDDDILNLPDAPAAF